MDILLTPFPSLSMKTTSNITCWLQGQYPDKVPVFRGRGWNLTLTIQTFI